MPKGGTVGQANPFYNYTNGLRHFHQLDDAPPIVNGILPVLPELQPLMLPAGLETLLPQQPGNSIPMQQYASGGIVTLTPYQRALLDTIAGPESAGRYNVMYGGKRFSDYSDHPRVAVPIKSGPNVGKTSSAAGKYQFLGSTWDQYKKKLGLPDFSPQSQDQAAWALAKDSYGGNLDAVLQSGDPKAIAQVGTKLRNIWTSLPGGIEQGTNTSRFVQTFQNNLVNPGKALPQSATSPMMMGAKNPNFHVPATMPGSTGLAALAPAIPVKTTSVAPPAANPLSGFMGLMALAQMQQPKPTPAPAPVSRGTRRVVDYEEETENTSQTPGYYRRKRRRNG